MKRTLKSNRQTFYYALYEDKEMIEDDYGNMTGEWKLKYSKPKKAKGNISAARGESQTRLFGEDLNYTNTLKPSKMKTEITETSILWIDTLPELDSDGETNTPHDYIVVLKGSSLNSVLLAIRKVSVSN